METQISYPLSGIIEITAMFALYWGLFRLLIYIMKTPEEIREDKMRLDKWKRKNEE